MRVGRVRDYSTPVLAGAVEPPTSHRRSSMLHCAITEARNVLTRIVDWALARAGFSLRPLSPEGWRWSDTVDDYYPVLPRPRWEPAAPHRQLRAILEAGRPTYEATLDLFSTHRATLHAVRHHQNVNRP